MTRIQRLKREQKQLVKRIADTEAIAKQYTDKAAALRHLLILNGRDLMASQPARRPVRTLAEADALRQRWAREHGPVPASQPASQLASDTR